MEIIAELCSRITHLHLNFGYLCTRRFHAIILQCPSLQSRPLVGNNKFGSLFGPLRTQFEHLSPIRVRLPSLFSLQLYGVGTLVSFKLLRPLSSSLALPHYVIFSCLPLGKTNFKLPLGWRRRAEELPCFRSPPAYNSVFRTSCRRTRVRFVIYTSVSDRYL